MSKWFAGLLVLPALAASLPMQNLAIDHQPIGCAGAGKFPRLEARFTPPEAVAVARVVFQGRTADWYSVAMKAEGDHFAGVLPKPNKDLKSFRYYIEVVDKAMGANRTDEYTAAVVDSASACRGKLMAGALGSATVILQGPAGVAALPAGFASAGVVAGSAAGSSAGAAGAAGASSAGAGGGIGATALVVGGLAAAGGAAAVVASKGGGESDPGSSGSSGTGTSPPLYSVRFLPNPPGIDVSICVGRPLSWASQVVSVDASGNFDQTWAPNEPNTARISGSVNATSFQATLTCINGARSGTISATGSNNSYNGTFSFGSSTGQVSITKQ